MIKKNLKQNELEQLQGLPSADEVTSHFSVPEGYFDSLAENIMVKVKEYEAQPIVEEDAGKQRPRWMAYARPLVYMAASFVLMIAMFRVFDSYLGNRTPESELLAEDRAYIDFFYEDCQERLVEDTFIESRYIYNSLYGDGSQDPTESEDMVLDMIVSQM